MNKYKNKTVLSINAKCSDGYSHTIYKKDGTIQSQYDGYVPSFMPGEHFGDYIELDIDPYTGVILNWRKWQKAKNKRSKNGKTINSK